MKKVVDAESVFLAEREKRIQEKIRWLRKNFAGPQEWDLDRALWFAASQMVERDELNDIVATQETQTQETLDALFSKRLANALKLTWKKQLEPLAIAGNIVAKYFIEFEEATRQERRKAGGKNKAAKLIPVRTFAIDRYKAREGKWSSASHAAKVLHSQIAVFAQSIDEKPPTARTISRWISRLRDKGK